MAGLSYCCRRSREAFGKCFYDVYMKRVVQDEPLQFNTTTTTQPQIILLRLYKNWKWIYYITKMQIYCSCVRLYLYVYILIFNLILVPHLDASGAEHICWIDSVVVTSSFQEPTTSSCRLFMIISIIFVQSSFILRHHGVLGACI